MGQFGQRSRAIHNWETIIDGGAANVYRTRSLQGGMYNINRYTIVVNY